MNVRSRIQSTYLGRINLKMTFTEIVFTETAGGINTTNCSPLNQCGGFLSRLVMILKQQQQQH